MCVASKYVMQFLAQMKSIKKIEKDVMISKVSTTEYMLMLGYMLLN